MTAIRVIFDGTAFIPQQPVSLPAQSEAIVFFDASDPAARQRLHDVIRAYYQGAPEAEDDAWAAATAPGSHRAWDDD